MLRPSIRAVLPFVCLAACAGPRPDEGPAQRESIGTVQQPIVGGTVSTATQNAVVLIARPLVDAVEVCSGTMLTPRLVLTARHCLAHASSTVTCTATGETKDGIVTGAVEPESLLVYGGIDRPERGASPSKGVKIIDDGAATLCNHDLALLLVDEPVANATIAPIRLEDVPPGKEVTLVGWGIDDESTIPDARRQRTGVRVVAIGERAGLGPAEFAVGEGACDGDSGGPALAASGAIVGLSSRGESDPDASGASACLGGLTIYTAPAGFKELILAAYHEAGQEPWLEGQPNPLLAQIGAGCEADADCQTGACSLDERKCAPAGTREADASVAGCATSGAPGKSGLLPIALATLVPLLARRRRSVRPQRTSVNVP